MLLFFTATGSSITGQIPLFDPAWTIFPDSEGGLEALMGLGFIILSVILLRLSKSRFVLWLVTGIYLFAILYFTLLTRHPMTEPVSLLKPFATVHNAVSWGDSGIIIINKTNLYALIANILLFLPAGFLIPKLWGKARHWYIAIPAGLFISAFIEVTQYLTKLGCFDVDDLITNTLGAAMGYLIYRLLLK